MGAASADADSCNATQFGFRSCGKPDGSANIPVGRVVRRRVVGRRVVGRVVGALPSLWPDTGRSRCRSARSALRAPKWPDSIIRGIRDPGRIALRSRGVISLRDNY